MSEYRQHAEKPLAIDERRANARTPVSPQAFVKFGENNYGFVFNLSESGLVFAPTGPLTLAVGGVAKMRFLLPDSREWIQTNGEVAWIGESQKEVGVRFVDLADDTREKIRSWISQEPSRAQAVPQRGAIPELNKGVKDGARIPASSGAAGVIKPGTFVDGPALNSILADPARLLRETKSRRPKLAPPQQTVPDEPPQTGNRVRVPERRSHMRRRVFSLEYIDLGSYNGGILINLSEGGMYVQAVAILSREDLPQIGFRLPDLGYLIKTNANIAWVGESKKDAGIQFVNLPEEARLKIREWVALEHPPLESSVSEPDAKVAPAQKKPERLLEMPSPGLSIKGPKFQDASAQTPHRGDGAVASPVNVPSADRPAGGPIELLHLSGPILQTRLGDLPNASEAATSDVISSGVVKRRGLRSLVAVVFIVTLLSSIAGWIVAGPGGRKQFLGMFTGQQNQTPAPAQNPVATQMPATVAENTALTTAPNDTAGRPMQTPPAPSMQAPDKPEPAKTNGSVQPSPSHTASSGLSATNSLPPQPQKPVVPAPHTNVPSIASTDANRATPPSQPLASNTISRSSSASAENKTQEIRPAQPSPSRPLTTPPVPNPPVSEKARPSPSTSSASSKPAAGTIAPPTSTVAPLAAQPPAVVAPAPTAATPPAPAEVVKGTVSITASPFPSIRVPAELKSQISKQGASLQLGQLISRVEPVYPEDAEHQRVEGIVKLHVIIDRDGNIQNVDQMSGPPLLEAAAANAVRQWRYKPTSLGGQPVEAGVDVTVTFRLQVTHAN